MFIHSSILSHVEFTGVGLALPCHARKHRFGSLFFTSHVEFTDVFPFEPIRFTYLRYQTFNTCHQPKKAFEPISSEHSNAKMPIKVFPWKRKAQIGDVASRADCHARNAATHHTICKWWRGCPTTRLEFWPQAVTTFKPWTSQTR